MYLEKLCLCGHWRFGAIVWGSLSAFTHCIALITIFECNIFENSVLLWLSVTASMVTSFSSILLVVGGIKVIIQALLQIHYFFRDILIFDKIFKGKRLL